MKTILALALLMLITNPLAAEEPVVEVVETAPEVEAVAEDLEQDVTVNVPNAEGDLDLVLQRLQTMSPRAASKIVAAMPPGLGAKVILAMPPERGGKLLQLMKPNQAARILQLMEGSYP